MIIRINKSRRSFSIVLAVWFVFLSVSVHMFHRHPGVLVGEHVNAGTRAISVCPDSARELQYFRACSDRQRPASRVGGLCPICLFLAKHTADYRSAWLNPTPKSEASRYATCDVIVPVSFLDLPTAGPRAPPC
jgi:hypothetical protein